MIFQPGQKLYGDRYQIIQQIGRGGFAITYLAEDNKGKQVVIKTLNKFAQNSPDIEQSQSDFKDEALKLASCSHPHIAKYENFFNEVELPCLVMEYIPRTNLWDTIKNKGVLDERRALLYVAQIGSALMETHSKGLLHRDVKPNNIMLRNNWEAVLIDFGLARDFIANQTQSENEPLTHGFAAFEQYIKGSSQGEFTDVYGLASTLYYLLTGILPTPSFSRATGIALQKPIDINLNINPGINQAILMGMTLYPDDDNRPKSIQDWLDSFGTFIPSVDSNAPTWRIPGIKPLTELEAEGYFETETHLIKLPKFELLKGFITAIKEILQPTSPILVSPKVNSFKELKYKSYLLLQQIGQSKKNNYNSREQNIADLLIARNLAGLFERLLELKGLRIGQNYRLRWLYAVGGQSVVYLAEKSNQDLVIVKIPYLDYHRPAYISQEQINKSRSHLIQEAELLKKFNYTNLPNFYNLIYSTNPLHANHRDTETVNREPYLVMEFIEGVDLLELTRYFHNQSSIDYQEIEIIAWKTVSKMTDFCITLFKEGYLYSDINPLNFIFTYNSGQLRFLDAGSLIPVNPEPNISPPFTESYIPVEYFEAYEQGKMIYPNSQYVMYALGKMLWEILTNKQPYPGEQPNLSEPIFQKYSPDLNKLINSIIQNQYSSFESLKKVIDSMTGSTP